MLKRCLMTMLWLPTSLFAFSPFVVKDIKVEGLHYIEEGTFYSYLPVELGDEISENDSQDIIKSLYQTGFFEEIDLNREGDTLVVHVKERPVIASINLSGNEELKTEDLKKALKESGLAEGRTYNPALLDRLKTELAHQYFNMGRYGVKIQTHTEPVEGSNRLAINIDIHEGEVAKIRSIHIVGNQVFSEDELRKQFQLTTPGIVAWIKNTDQYSKQKLQGDLETLRSYYMDRGYIEFKIDSTQVTLTPDKENVYITINVAEGARYHFGEFKLMGDYGVPEATLFKHLTAKSGDIFSRKQVTDFANAIGDELGSVGFAFAHTNPVPQVNPETKQVDMVFYIDPGKRVSVRRVLFHGNQKTHDEVLRREMTQMEEATVSTKKIQESRTELNRAGFFKDVKVETRPVPGEPDKVDVVYSVEEAPLGKLEGGVGYSNTEGVLFNASVSNKNFLGTGNSLDFSFNNSKAYTTYTVGYLNPYYTIDGVSRGFNLFYTKTDPGRISDVTNYSTNTLGGSVNFGVPLSPVDTFSFVTGVQRTDLSSTAYAPQEIFDFIHRYGSQYDELDFTLGLSHNTLDRYIFPENGFSESLAVTFSTPGSDLEYYRMRSHSRWYKPLGAGFIGNIRTTLGYGDGYGKTDALPFYQHFYMGGSKTLRGFEENTLGPRDTNGKPFGGNASVSATAAIILPNFVGDDKTMRTSVFLDMGQVYDLARTKRLEDDHYVSRNPAGLRYAVGVSLTWISPFAPLEFSLATPLNAANGESEQAFAFNFGTTF